MKKHFFLILLLLISGCMPEPDIPPGSKCIGNLVYFEPTKDVWLAYRGQGYIYGIHCQSAASAAGK